MNRLNMFHGKWGAIPYALSTLVTGDSFLVLFHIIRHSRKAVGDQPVKLSKRILAKLIGRSRNTLDGAIEKLVSLNLITIAGGERELLSFVINWDEIKAIDTLCSKVNDEGWIKLREHCLHNRATPFTNLSADICSEIESQYKFESGSEFEPDTACEDSAGSKIEPEVEQLAQLLGQIMSSGSEFEPAKRYLVQKLSQIGFVYSKIKPDTTKVAVLEPYNSKETIQLSKTAGSKIEPDEEKSGSAIEPDPLKSGSIFEHSKDIYIDNNKDDKGIKENIKKYFDRDDFIVKWALERDLEKYEKLPESEFENILSNPNFYSSSEDVLLREVWRDLQGLRDWENEENFQSNSFMVPVSTFRDLLYRVMEELKEQLPDFNISEEQAKSMFGFELVQDENGPSFLVSSSSIRNITVQTPVRQRNNKDRPTERAKNIIFMDCLESVSDDKLEDLTSAEYATLMLADYISKQKKDEIPHPDELIKSEYYSLLQKISDESTVPVDDLKALWKELPIKANRVYLHLQRLLVDKIWQYNRDHNEISKLEIEWKQKYGS